MGLAHNMSIHVLFALQTRMGGLRNINLTMYPLIREVRASGLFDAGHEDKWLGADVVVKTIITPQELEAIPA